MPQTLLTSDLYIGIFVYMDKKLKDNGRQVMVQRLFFMEPELLNMLETEGRKNSSTRSTMARKIIKSFFLNRYKNVTCRSEIDWSECI